MRRKYWDLMADGSLCFNVQVGGLWENIILLGPTNMFLKDVAEYNPDWSRLRVITGWTWLCKKVKSDHSKVEQMLLEDITLARSNALIRDLLGWFCIQPVKNGELKIIYNKMIKDKIIRVPQNKIMKVWTQKTILSSGELTIQGELPVLKNQCFKLLHWEIE